MFVLAQLAFNLQLWGQLLIGQNSTRPQRLIYRICFRLIVATLRCYRVFNTRATYCHCVAHFDLISCEASCFNGFICCPLMCIRVQWPYDFSSVRPLICLSVLITFYFLPTNPPDMPSLPLSMSISLSHWFYSHAALSDDLFTSVKPLQLPC